jgi:hypothetical protein
MRSTVGAIVCLLALPAWAGAQSREFSRTVELKPGGVLRLTGTKGSMRITSWSEPKVEIRARIERPDDADDDYAARAIEATEIAVVGDQNAVTVATDYDRVPTRDGHGSWGNRSVPPVHYEIRAPRKLDVRVNSDRGPLFVSGFEGSIDIVADRGELEITDVGGDVKINVDRGDRSRLSRLRGRLDVEADRTDLDIDADVFERASRIEVDRGDVEVRVPESLKLTVRTDISRRGHFSTDLPIQWTSADPKHSEGHINGGGAELVVASDRARIDLRRKAK